MAFISSIEDITKLHFTFFILGNQFILPYPFYLIHIKISISFTYKHFEQELLSWKILDLNPIFYCSQVTLGRSLTHSSGLTVKGVIGTTTKKPARWLFAWPRENQYCGIEFFVQHSTQIAFDLPTCTPKWIDLMSNERKSDLVLVIPFPMKTLFHKQKRNY